MAEDRGEFMERLLREVRNDVAEIRRAQGDHTKLFEQVFQRFDEVHESLFTSLGMAAHANVRHDTVQKRLDEFEERLKRLEEKV
jgi:uncharacterized coiled-coil protein SlyX